MTETWWFVHMIGISLWFGVTVTVLLLWPSGRAWRDVAHNRMDLTTLVALETRASHLGAILTAVGGVGLSFEEPKSQLGLFWLVVMQGLGPIAFVLSVFVLPQVGKRLRNQMATGAEPAITATYSARYRMWLGVVLLLLVICFWMAAFKPLL